MQSLHNIRVAEAGSLKGGVGGGQREIDTMLVQCFRLDVPLDNSLVITSLKGQSNEILILFFTYINRPRPEYEPLLILKFFRSPHDFTTNTAFFSR